MVGALPRAIMAPDAATGAAAITSVSQVPSGHVLRPALVEEADGAPALQPLIAGGQGSAKQSWGTNGRDRVDFAPATAQPARAKDDGLSSCLVIADEPGVG